MTVLEKLFIRAFILLLVSSCSNMVRITRIPSDPPILKNKNVKILLHLYDEPNVLKKIKIVSETGELLYTNHKSLKFEKTEFVEISVPHRTKYLIIHYNKGKNKIPIRPEYEYLYIEFRNKNLLEVVYSVSKPAYT